MSVKSRVAVWVVLGVVFVVGARLWQMKMNRIAPTPPGTGDACCPPDARVKPTPTGGEKTGNPTPSRQDEPELTGGTGSVAQVTSGRPIIVLDAVEAEAERVIAPFQEDLDSGDLKVVAEAARKLMDHPNAKVRLQAVESLAWAESDGFPYLSKLLLDKDTDVALAALEAWALQMQNLESTETKAALLAEVGPRAMGMGADAFQNVLDAMFDMPDAAALKLLQGFAAQAEDPEILGKITEIVNFRAMPDDEVETRDDIPQAIRLFLKREAEEAAAEAAGDPKGAVSGEQ